MLCQCGFNSFFAPVVFSFRRINTVCFQFLYNSSNAVPLKIPVEDILTTFACSSFMTSIACLSFYTHTKDDYIIPMYRSLPSSSVPIVYFVYPFIFRLLPSSPFVPYGLYSYEHRYQRHNP